MGSAFYYLSLAVIGLAMGVFNLSVSSSGTGLQCYSVSQMDLATFQQFNSTFPTGVAAGLYYPDTTDPTIINVRQTASNTFNILILILSIIYLTIMGLSLLLSLIIATMSNMLPDDFLKIGKCKKCMAAFSKILPPVFNILSWLLMVLIIAIWVMYMMQSCVYSTTTASGLFDPGSFFKSVGTLNLVNSAIWFILHYVMSIFREISYQEPFMYSPDDSEHSFARICLFKKLGP